MESTDGVTVLGCPKLLETLKIVLASQSPRRLEILQHRMGFKHVIAVPSSFPEDLNKEDFKCPSDYAKETARRKAEHVAERIWGEKGYPVRSPSNQRPPEADLIIAADTIVVLGKDRVLEKPTGPMDAIRMLSDIANYKKPHHVITGVAMWTKSAFLSQAPAVLFAASSEVQFGDITLKDIEHYVATNESLDKSGSYGIEGRGSLLVKSINGCFYNIQGLPLYETSAHIAELFCQGLLKNS